MHLTKEDGTEDEVRGDRLGELGSDLSKEFKPFEYLKLRSAVCERRITTSELRFPWLPRPPQLRYRVCHYRCYGPGYDVWADAKAFRDDIDNLMEYGTDMVGFDAALMFRLYVDGLREKNPRCRLTTSQPEGALPNGEIIQGFVMSCPDVEELSHFVVAVIEDEWGDDW